MLAVQLGRPLGIDDMDIDAELPLPFDDEDLPAYFEDKHADRTNTGPTLMQGFIGLTRLYRIAGRVLRHIYSLDKLKEQVDEHKMAELKVVVERLDAQLDKWCQDLHPSFRTSPTTPQMVCIWITPAVFVLLNLSYGQTSLSAVLCSSYYAVLITLHRSFIPSRRGIASAIGSTSVPKAIAASRSCIFLATQMGAVIPPSHHLAIFIQYLFSSGLIILLVVMHATHKGAAEVAMSEVENCRSALERLEHQWPGANKCKELLVELSQVTRDSLAKGEKATRRFAPSENANTVASTNRGFSIAPTTPKISQTSSSGSARQSVSPRSNDGCTFNFNSPTGPAATIPHLSSSPTAPSRKRQREETPEPRSSSKRPSHRPQLSAPGNIQGLALSNVSGGPFAPFLGAQAPVYQPQGAWQPQVHPQVAVPLDTDPPPFAYHAPHGPSGTSLSPLSRMHLQFASNTATGNEIPMFDVGAAPPYDITSLPPFSGMNELWTNFGGESDHMDLWSTMPDAFNGAPPTAFGLGEESLLNMNGETGAA